MLRRKHKSVILRPDEIEKMREAGQAAAVLLRELVQMVKPGISTQDLDDHAQAMAKERGYRNAPLGYHGFPRSICTSVNEVVCHGIPSAAIRLQAGDIVGIDVTPIVGGYHGDSCATVPVGEVRPEIAQLIADSNAAMFAGISTIRAGSNLNEIGVAIQRYAESRGYAVVRDFVGHAIGKVFHGDLMVYHVKRRGRGLILETGMTFTVEPMLTLGGYSVKVLDDDWTAVTCDASWSAQFEHTVTVTPDGVEILTRHPDVDPWSESPGGVIKTLPRARS